MKTNEWKKHCKVTGDGRCYDGVAHIVQIQYDERFAPWFAAIQLADKDAIGMPREIEVEFENGRKASCRISSRHNDGFVAYLEGEMETPAVQIYVAGTGAISSLRLILGNSPGYSSGLDWS